MLLKQRHDELPKLVETCKQYMQFEQETLTRVMEARARVATARESGSVGSLGQAEAYPELRTDQTFQQLQTRISALENAIADRREFYN